MPKRKAAKGKKPGKPKIGIWWRVKGRVVCFKDDPETVSAPYGMRDSPRDHIKAWPQVVRKHPFLRQIEYDEIPRGRIIEKSGDFFILIGEKESKDHHLVAQVCKAFNLPARRAQVIADEHYTTGIPGLMDALLSEKDEA
jgi:hypothetical protein